MTFHEVGKATSGKKSGKCELQVVFSYIILELRIMDEWEKSWVGYFV